MKIKILYIVILIAILILSGLYFFNSNGNQKFNYEIYELKKTSIEEKIMANGKIQPISTVIIGAQVSGIIKEIYVDYNSIVKKNQILALIDPATFKAQVEQAKANLAIVNANLEKAKINLFLSESNYKRYESLYKEKLISESEYETYLMNYKSALANLADARAKVTQAKASLQQALTNLYYTQIRSPISGIVISRNIEVGQVVTASFQSPELFTIAKDLSKMMIIANIDESEIGKIREGLLTYFRVDAYPELTFFGKIIQIRNSPVIVENVVTYEVIILVENKQMMFKPGMTAYVTIQTKKKDNIFIVPSSALRVQLSNIIGKNLLESNRQGIWILENQKPRRIEIQTGIYDGNYIEIMSPELKEGLQVIVNIKITNQKKQRLF